MRAVAIQEFGGPEKLAMLDLPRPRRQRDEVLVRVVAAGVSPLDCRIRQGAFQDVLPHAFPLIPGFDLAGVVEEFGEGVSRFRRGERVWGFTRPRTLQWGCYCEYVNVPESSLAIMPTRLLFEEAAAVPFAGLTAYQSLFEREGLSDESTVLVLGAAGGVGHFAVRLAANAGARVLATAAAADASFVLGLGAQAAIDPEREGLVEAVGRHCPGGVSVVVDTAGGELLRLGAETLAPGGRLVSVAERPDAGTRADFLLAQPNANQLDHLARMIDAKQLEPAVHKIFSLANAAEAHRTLETGGVRGKLVLNL